MKNQRLKLKDLFNGRVVYMAEPGVHPVKMVCGQSSNGVLRYSTIMLDTSGKSHEELLKQHNGKYTIVSQEMMVKMAQKANKPIPVGTGLIKHHVQPTVVIEITDDKGNKHYFQDIYFDPSESRMKAFAKLKQAERYSDYPKKFGEGLESIFVTSDSE